MFQERMQVPHFGFTIQARKREISRDIACKTLIKNRQIITCAKKNGDKITVLSHVIVCPYCGKETPAYQEVFSVTANKTIIPYTREIEAWCLEQMPLLKSYQDSLYFNTPLESFDEFMCPQCSAVSTSCDGVTDVSIRVKRKTIAISCELDIEDLFCIPWLDSEVTLPDIKIYETLTFNLKKGRIFVALEDSAGKRIKIRDVSNVNIDSWVQDPIVLLFYNQKKVSREFYRQFARLIKGPMPFPQKCLSPCKYMLLTLFVGYQADFYHAVPYTANDTLVEQSFLKTAKKLHWAKCAPQLFESSQLPNVKSIRKEIFSNPGLLFYITELNLLWEIIGDINRLRTFLQSSYLYRELVHIHKMPALIDFYREYQKVFGAAALLKCMGSEQISWRLWKNYAFRYLALSPYEQKSEQKKWEEGFPAESIDYNVAMGEWFSVPVPMEQIDTDKQTLLEGSVKGYEFHRLSNSTEYLKAGLDLHNCLTHWEDFTGNVYGIKRGSHYVGAVEITCGRIIQAYIKDNNNIEDDEKIYAAYNKWRLRSRLSEKFVY